MRLLAAAACLLCVALTSPPPDLRVPAFTAYIAPDADGARVSRDRGVTGWTAPGMSVSWFGEFKVGGTVTVAVAARIPAERTLRLRLTSGHTSHDATPRGGDGDLRVDFGEFAVGTGYAKFELALLDTVRGAEISALLLDGAPVAQAHFNLDPRRNAASVHLRYPVDTSERIIGFYNEVTGVEDPVTTYYMACGFARGYFGMQVNSATERRIIFSVWDAGTGTNAQNRSTVAADDQVQLLGKGDGVDASVFGNEGTGGHSHLVYNWKTGTKQRFYVAAKAEGTHTDYSGYWFNPDKNDWQLIASFRAPKDGQLLRSLYSFSEDFGGSTGHLLRKALYGPQWVLLANGQWKELTTATFTHDATGRENRLDRFAGVENGQFFLSHGGFVSGFTKSGDAFTRPASGSVPEIAARIAARAR